MDRLKSRKFWLTVAIILGGVASAISGICTDNQLLTAVGVICGTIATCIYTIMESVVDTTRIEETGNTVTETVYVDEGQFVPVSDEIATDESEAEG